MDNIEHLYKCYDILSDAGDKISDHVAEYKDILKAVKGSTKEKRLAAQFVCNFFKYFPELLESALDAQLDLCEDTDTQIRRQAIKNLPKFCQSSHDPTIIKVAEALTQLLVLEDAAELLQVHNSLQAVIKLNPMDALSGVFHQIYIGDESIRERSLKFISSKLFATGPTVVTKELEAYVVEEVKKVLQDVSADEFHLCMSILRATKLGSTTSGHAELVNLAIEQSELNAYLDDTEPDEEAVERLILCATEAMPFFSPTIKSTAFIVFVCDKLFPIWKSFDAEEQQGHLQLRLLKIFAELVTHSDVLENAGARINNIYHVLLKYMPLPQLVEDSDDDVSTAVTPSFEFSHAECLLYALHTLGKKQPTALTFVDDADKLKDFRDRLQYLARGTQGYIKKLEELIRGQKTAEQPKTEEQKLRATALKTTSNINVLIRDLFHAPPIFKHDVQLSWVEHKNKKLPAGKRQATYSYSHKSENGGVSEEKKSRVSTDRRIYSPPSGKYSANVQNYGDNSHRGRSRQAAGGSGSGGGGGGYRNRRGYKKY